VEGISGRVPMRWHVEPRFEYGQSGPRIGRRGETPVATAGRDALAVSTWAAGDPVLSEGSMSGRFVATPGQAALVVLSVAHQEPLVFPSRSEAGRACGPQTGCQRSMTRW
jgi:hypothetical protein